MYSRSRRFFSRLARSVGAALAGLSIAASVSAAPTPNTVAGMPPLVNASNLYGEAGAGHFSPAVKNALPRIYVPNLRSNDVYVIDPATFKVVDRFRVGYSPQHVVPSWDLQTLWVANNAEGRTDGSLTPVDPKTGKPGKEIMVDDPYNMYFTPDGREAIVVAEAHARLDFRDPHTMALKSSLSVPECKGINHADFSIDGRYVLFTCEFGGKLAKIDLVNRKVVGYLQLDRKGMPQDIRISPDGKVFYVADMRLMAFSWSTATASRRLASSRPVSARTVCIRAAMAPACTSPIEAPIWFTVRVTARAVCRCSTSPHAKSWRPGRFRAAAVRIWAMSAPMAGRCGCPAGTTMSFMRSIRPQEP